MKRFTGRILCSSPLVIFCPLLVYEDQDWGFDELLSLLGDDHAIILLNLYWSAEEVHDLRKLLEWRENRKPRNIEFIFITNTILEKNLLKNEGLEAEFFNQNAFIDSNIFELKNLESHRTYEAIYNAAFHPYKRIELASELNNLLIISRSIEDEYYLRIKKIMNFTLANVINADRSTFRFLSRKEIVDFYNNANCGLALSSKEGAMFTSVECLLCGLPIVSTHSLGGRDVFLNSNNSIVCSDNSSDIYNAVLKFQKLSLSERFYIRNETIKLQSNIIMDFKIFLNNIINNRFNKSLDIDNLYNFSYTNCLSKFYTSADLFMKSEIKRFNNN